MLASNVMLYRVMHCRCVCLSLLQTCSLQVLIAALPRSDNIRALVNHEQVARGTDLVPGTAQCNAQREAHTHACMGGVQTQALCKPSDVTASADQAYFPRNAAACSCCCRRTCNRFGPGAINSGHLQGCGTGTGQRVFCMSLAGEEAFVEYLPCSV